MNAFLERREVGRTGMQTARLGIGSTFDAPASAIEEAFEHGINYLYWGTVRRPEFARAMVNLSKGHRDELILTIQSYSKDPDSIEGEVEDALESADLEHFDFLLLGNRSEVPEDAYVEVFERLRERGKVRFMSISSHNRPMLPTLLASHAAGDSPYELLMLRYNAVHRGAERDVFPSVPETGPKPLIVAYTATRWRHLLDPDKMPPGEQPLTARDCYRYSLSHPAVDMVLCGPASTEQMREALLALERGPLEADERARIERIGAHIYGRYPSSQPDGGDAEDMASGVAAR